MGRQVCLKDDMRIGVSIVERFLIPIRPMSDSRSK